MAERYIYKEKLKRERNNTGWGLIIDSASGKSWEKEVATVYGQDKAELILNALNLKEGLSSLRKGCTKNEILIILKKYRIEI